MIRDHLPRALGWLTTFAIVLLGTWGAGVVVADFVPAAPSAPLEITTTPSAAARDIAARLPRSTVTETRAPAAERFELLGLVHATNERAARAVIRVAGSDKPGVYAPGDDVGAGARLEQVTRDTAELSVGGRRLTLALPQPARTAAEKKTP